MLKVNGVSFQGVNTQAVSNNVTAPQNEVQSAKKMSKTAKVAIGTSLLALAAVGVYVVTKNKKAAEALAQEAKSFGFEDVKAFKHLKNRGCTFTKVDAVSKDCIDKWAEGIAKKNNIESTYDVALISSAQLKDTFLKVHSKKVKVPEKCFVRTMSVPNAAGERSFVADIVCYDKIDESMENGMKLLNKEGVLNIKMKD